MPKGNSRVRLDAGVHETLYLWESLLTNMHRRLTHLRELFPVTPSWFGETDTCGHELGDVFFDNNSTAFIWQLPLPTTVTKQLQSISNPWGTISMNNLELPAHVIQVLLKSQKYTLYNTQSTAPTARPHSPGLLATASPTKV